MAQKMGLQKYNKDLAFGLMSKMYEDETGVALTLKKLLLPRSLTQNLYCNCTASLFHANTPCITWVCILLCTTHLAAADATCYVRQLFLHLNMAVRVTSLYM